MTSPFGFTSKTDGVDDHLASHVNALQLAADVLAKSPDGTMFNGKIQVTVAANSITVEIKTLDGNDPSASDPVYIVIGGIVRALTDQLITTRAAGTNWCNSGSAELAAKQVDYFVYVIWNTTPATDVLDIGFARIPYGRIYSDFSGTTTNEKYLAYGNVSAPNAANDCVVIGRFAATLSAAAGHNWSVPAFTTVNLIQRPIYETRTLSWTPTITYSGGATNPTSYTVNTANYKLVGGNLSMTLNATLVRGTGDRTNIIHTLPFTNTAVIHLLPGMDNITAAGLSPATACYLFTDSKLYYQRTMANNGQVYVDGTYMFN